MKQSYESIAIKINCLAKSFRRSNSITSLEKFNAYVKSLEDNDINVAHMVCPEGDVAGNLHTWRNDAHGVDLVKDGVRYMAEIIIGDALHNDMLTQGNLKRTKLMMANDHHEWIKKLYDFLLPKYPELRVLCGGGTQRQAMFYCGHKLLASAGFELANNDDHCFGAHPPKSFRVENKDLIPNLEGCPYEYDLWSDDMYSRD